MATWRGGDHPFEAALYDEADCVVDADFPVPEKMVLDIRFNV